MTDTPPRRGYTQPSLPASFASGADFLAEIKRALYTGQSWDRKVDYLCRLIRWYEEAKGPLPPREREEGTL